MLVLSRRLNETVLFPGTQTAVRVTAIKRGVVRLGIEAPPDVAVLRGELAGDSANREPAADPLDEQLRALSIGLGLVRLRLQTGDLADAQGTLCRLQQDIQAMRRSRPVKRSVARTEPAPRPRAPVIDLGAECELLAACAG